MSIPKPPFHSASEELLYNIYLKLGDVASLTENDINTVAKLNALILDGDLVDTNYLATTLNGLKGSVPAAGDSLEKLYNLIQGIDALKAEDIDTLAEINAILSGTDLIDTAALTNAVNSVLESTWQLGGSTIGSIKSIGTKDNFALPFITNNIERGRFTETGKLLIGSVNSLLNFEWYALQVTGSFLNSGATFLRDGNVNINLGIESTPIQHTFRLNTYIGGLGGVDFIFSGANQYATLEISDALFGGTRPEVLRISTGGYADTAILVRPNDGYNTRFGYKYVLQGTNTSGQSRYVSAFYADVTWPIDDQYVGDNHAQLFVAKGSVTNHRMDGFFASVTGTAYDTEAYAFRSLASRVFFDGDGMLFQTPIVSITTDDTPHIGGTAFHLAGNDMRSAGLFIVPRGAERTGVIISPGQAQANGLFISPQYALNSHDYDGYLALIQYTTRGNNMLGSTDKPMLFIRKTNSVLNGKDHTGAFIRMEENIQSTGGYIEATRYDSVSNTHKLKFSVDKDGVISIGQIAADPAAINTVGRLYLIGDTLKLVTPSGVVKTITTV